MKVMGVFAVVFCVVGLGLCQAAETGELKDAAKAGGLAANAGTKYDILLESLLKRVQSKDPSLGDKGAASKAFKELRFAYAETPQYNPYGGVKVEVSPVMWEAVKNKKYEEALQCAEKILKENFVDIDAHMVASTACRKTGNQEKADYHAVIVNSLILSILEDGGDGSKPETAMEVISTDEEYSILNYAGLRAGSQAVLQTNGHYYDKFTTVDRASGKTFEIYFCIDKPYTRLQSSFKTPHK
ncbi:MAG: DUF4919 domain-containing protein [Syntrophorhabdales bacterium]|jgi:hypothetical protein